VTDVTSTFTFRGLIEALKWLEPRQTALLRGRHGIGKSAIAYQMAEHWGFDTVIERRISQLSEGDMIGLPDRGAVRTFDGSEFNVTSFLPTDWFLEAQFKPCLIFLDEINRGTPETMQACFQFVEKGELNGRKIHPDSRIIAAVNYSKEYQVVAMDQAFIDRFWIADVEPDKEDWLTWARNRGNISSEIIDFIIQCNEDHFEIRPEKAAQMSASEVTPSRRSWERLDRHITKKRGENALIDMPTSSVFYDVCRGFVGPDASRALSKFLSEQESNVTPDDIINNYKKVASKVKKMKPENKTAMIDKIKHYLIDQNIMLDEKQAINLSNFFKAIPPEMGVVMWAAILSTKNMANTTLFHKHICKYFIETLAGSKLANINV
jgi:hypothetical protein